MYLATGLGSGLAYREITKAQDFDGFTQLALVHTHILTLGVMVMLTVLVLEKVFTLSRSKAFSWFFWVYNIGLVITSTTMVINGILQINGDESSKAIAGISGSGHILLTIGLILLMVALGKRVRDERTAVTA